MQLGVVLWADFDRYVELQAVVVGALGASALSVAVASMLLPARIYERNVRALSLRVTETPLATPTTDYRTGGSERTFQDPDARVRIYGAFQPAMIVGLALAESISSVGVAVALGRLAPSWMALPFFAVSWILLAIRFPRAGSIEEMATRVYGARFPN